MQHCRLTTILGVGAILAATVRTVAQDPRPFEQGGIGPPGSVLRQERTSAGRGAAWYNLEARNKQLRTLLVVGATAILKGRPPWRWPTRWHAQCGRFSSGAHIPGAGDGEDVGTEFPALVRRNKAARYESEMNLRGDLSMPVRPSDSVRL